MEEDLIYRLTKRAEIRRNATTRKSVQEGAPDRIADLLEEAAARITELEKTLIFILAECDWEEMYGRGDNRIGEAIRNVLKGKYTYERH